MATDNPLTFPFFHLRDKDLQIKNCESFLDRGTYFDGSNIYYSTEMAFLVISDPTEVVQLANKGDLYCPILQLDKQSNEKAFQRTSMLSVEACSMVGLLFKTEIPDLRRLCFMEGRIELEPLFIIVSKKGSVFYTDEDHQ